MNTTPQSRVALISVYNKSGIVPFAKALVSRGFSILSSGGTAKVLTEAGIKVKDVSELVGGKAILGHRVVTLSREIHAGLMARYGNKEDMKELETLGVPYIDLVCNDLYPLVDEIAKADSTRESVIEQTDIGGPTMLRSAAKGGRIVICTEDDRQNVLDWLDAGEPDHDEFIESLRAKAEAYVAGYVLASARYHGAGEFDGMVGERTVQCKYGENGYQTPAALYTTGTSDPLALDKFELVIGTTPSYNNICDMDRLLQTITHVVAGQKSLDKNTKPLVAVAGKHGNCCGASVGDDAVTVTEAALGGDLRAIFGGMIMMNYIVDKDVAETLLHYKMDGIRRLLDGIMAPGFTDEAVEMLRRKNDKCRLLANPELANLEIDSLDTATRFRYVRGGFLTQANYTFVPNFAEIDGPKEKDAGQLRDMMLAWGIGSTSNSNTVTLVKDATLVGNGVGQQDRVGGAELAIKRAKDAGHQTVGAVAYSDSFFPFTDGVEVLVAAGIKAVLATSGSVKDEEVKAYCAEHDLAMYLIPDALGRGFFGH